MRDSWKADWPRLLLLHDPSGQLVGPPGHSPGRCLALSAPRGVQQYVPGVWRGGFPPNRDLSPPATGDHPGRGAGQIRESHHPCQWPAAAQYRGIGEHAKRP